METSVIPESAKPATPPTPTASAKPADKTTSSSSAPSASAPSINPATGVAFKEDCIVLVLGPQGTVHPMVAPKNPSGIRVFENSDAALSEVMASKIVSKRPFAIVALKGLF